MSHAREILSAAGCRESDWIFHANAFAVRDISIAAQRRRSLNLAWALHHTKTVRNGSVVGIVGAGFSGLALAVALALLDNCIVLIFESESEPLSVFKKAAHRFISPELNISGPIGAEDESPPDEIPLFDWSADYASAVAHAWQTEFDHFARALPVFLYTDTDCKAIRPDAGGASRTVVVDVTNRIMRQPSSIPVDVAIVATGFGREKNPLKSNDFSYWTGGAPLHYRTNKKTERVLIVGGGDSGVVEVLHYLIKDFSHEMVPGLVSVDRNAGSWLHSMEESSGFYELWRGDLSWDIAQPPAPRPVLAWYCSTKSLLTRNQHLVPQFRAGPLWQAFTTIERFLEKEGILRASVDPDGDLFGRRIAAMTKPACKRLDALMKPIIEAVAVPDLLSFLKAIAKPKVNLKRLRAATRRDVVVTWTTSPEEFISNAFLHDKVSELNAVLLTLLIEQGAVRFRPGVVKAIKRTSAGWLVSFPAVKRRFVFDRVVARMGPDRKTLQERFKPRLDRPAHEGNAIVSPYVWFGSGTEGGKLFERRAADDVRRSIEALGGVLWRDERFVELHQIESQRTFAGYFASEIARNPEATYKDLFSLRHAHGSWQFAEFYRRGRSTDRVAPERTSKAKGRRRS